MTSQPSKKDERHRPSGGPGDPCVMVIFGASGDLTKRKLLPALYNLARDGLLSKHFAVIGISRSEMGHEQFREKLGDDLREYAATGFDEKLWNWFAERLYYLPGDMNKPETYQRLEKLLSEVDQTHGTEQNHFYYLATAPQFFSAVVEQLGAAGLAQQRGPVWRRVIFEKPFGRDLASARQLNRDVSKVLEENQVYRIDHYLGKETVQNIMVLRFANGIFEPVWNRRYIDHVQITVSEDLGVEERGGYYEQSGALRDMVPNHIFQLISLTAMEPPISFDADAVRDEQAKVLRAIQPMGPEEVLRRTVRGQYGEGSIEGEEVPGYREEHKVSPESTTETFVAMKVYIDNWRWADVPFYLRTGKRQPKRVTEIGIQFKRAPFILFRQTAIQQLTPNRLTLRIQPDEGISLTFGAKVPGPVLKMGTVDMDFKYADYFGSKPSTGYERLLYDCMLGDATLFQRADMTEASWAVVEPILDVWKALPPRDFPNYAAGAWGPQAADDLLEREGRAWKLCSENGC
jgi:glucose-6-phosphate 1-dehydrogenase